MQERGPPGPSPSSVDPEPNATAFFVFDMPDSAALPAVAEPFFVEVDAAVEVVPAMNGEDLQRGLSTLA